METFWLGKIKAQEAEKRGQLEADHKREVESAAASVATYKVLHAKMKREMAQLKSECDEKVSESNESAKSLQSA